MCSAISCVACLPGKLKEKRGQATIEAAFALPVLMLLFLLLLQPGIVLYDRIVMQGAAAEGCRLLATTASNAGTNEDYIRRRLSAVPQIDQFHVHTSGCSWQIEADGDEMSNEVSVRIVNEVKPLPLLDFGMALMGLTNASGNLEIKVEASSPVQPDWVQSATEGRDPSAWPGIE